MSMDAFKKQTHRITRSVTWVPTISYTTNDGNSFLIIMSQQQFFRVWEQLTEARFKEVPKMELLGNL